jgi:protoporphyrinogen oxidase
VSRLSEPKNYRGRTEPEDRTVLCAEIPCDVDDTVWKQSDTQLGRLVLDSLEHSELPVRSEVLRVETKRLRFAYPVYRSGFEERFHEIDEWIHSVDGLITFGRQGLFAHDNIHHAMAMGYAAADCLKDSGIFDTDRWRWYRTEFESHVVED